MKYIGIDIGTETGIAIWDGINKAFDSIETMTITRAMEKVRELHRQTDVAVYIEDARLRTWFGNAGREKLQGAGSIKRDSKIWEDFCQEQGLNYQMIPPKNNVTKLDADQFHRWTGWDRRTSEHARDAAMLVFNR